MDLLNMDQPVQDTKSALNDIFGGGAGGGAADGFGDF